MFASLRARLDTLSLRARLVLSFAALAVLMAVAVGAPALWLVATQLDRQAWEQVERGSQVARALYAAQRSEVAGLATLTSQRPTLRQLIDQDDPEQLIAYLRTLQIGAGLDVVVVCGEAGRVLAQVGDAVSAGVCQPAADAGLRVEQTGGVTRAWMLSRYSLADGAPSEVVVGVALDYEFAASLRTQTGLEHFLLADDGAPIATSLAGGLSALASARTTPRDESGRRIVTLNGQRHYAVAFRLDGGGLSAEVALPVAALQNTQRRLVLGLAGGLLAVTALGALLGAWLAGGISRPLAQLSASAARLSAGDLERPMAVEAGMPEVALLAQTLETARAELRVTLGELRREKAWTGHLLEALVEGIVALDDAGRITFFSQGAARITGWPRDEALGRPADEVFRLLDADGPFSAQLPAPGRRRKLTLADRNGRTVIAAVTGARLQPPEAGEARVVLVFRDVSDEEGVHRLLGHFLANVAHEFRTPLSALAASTELLMDQAPDLRPDELQSLLGSLRLGLFSLGALVDNLLEGASIETGHFRVSPRPTDLRAVVAEAAQLVGPLLEKHGQRLRVTLPDEAPTLQADARRLVQVLVNLLSNANKYGPADGQIDLELTVGPDQVRVAVSDRGPGIPPDFRPDLFRRFAYPAQGKLQYGAGLGLSIVKAVVEAHGGQVGVDDRPGGGSTFWLTLPRGNAA